MELFRTTNIDWLGKKLYFLGFSLIFSVAGLLSILFWHHIPLGVDFKGGTQVRVAFTQLTGEDNGDAHLKSLLLHHETTLPITAGRLDLGTWQRVFYAEFDGQRRKRLIVKVLGVE